MLGYVGCCLLTSFSTPQQQQYADIVPQRLRSNSVTGEMIMDRPSRLSEDVIVTRKPRSNSVIGDIMTTFTQPFPNIKPQRLRSNSITGEVIHKPRISEDVVTSRKPRSNSVVGDMIAPNRKNSQDFDRTEEELLMRSNKEYAMGDNRLMYDSSGRPLSYPTPRMRCRRYPGSLERYMVPGIAGYEDVEAERGGGGIKRCV